MRRSLALAVVLALALSPGAAAHARTPGTGHPQLEKFDTRVAMLAASERGFGPVRLSEQAEFVYEDGTPAVFWVGEDAAGFFNVFALQGGGSVVLGLIERAVQDRTDTASPTSAASITVWRLSSTSVDAPVAETQTVVVERGTAECSVIFDLAGMVNQALRQTCGQYGAICSVVIAAGAVALCIASGPGSSDVYWYSGVSAERTNHYWSSSSNLATADYFVAVPSCSLLHSSDGICRLANGQTVTTRLSVLIRWPENWRTYVSDQTIRTHYYGSTAYWAYPVYIPQRGEYLMSVHVNGSQKAAIMPTWTLSSSYGQAVRLMNWS